MVMCASEIPKVIWIYWHQGTSNTPFLVKECMNSWRVRNPSWEIRLLDKGSLGCFVDMSEYENRSDIGLQMYTDLARLKLLSKYGGVWVDASLFCITSLDDWLFDEINNGFFVFASDRTDRLITNWFIAASPDNEFVNGWLAELEWFWLNNFFRKPNKLNRQVIRKAMSLRKRGLITNAIWFSKFFTKFLKLHPYPVNMYLFGYLLDKNISLRESWNNISPRFTDTEAEKLQNVFKLNDDVTELSRKFIDNTLTPVHKLNWRQDLGFAKKDSNFAYLLDRLK